MMMRVALALIFSLLPTLATASPTPLPTPPDVYAIMRRMKAALEPPRASLRDLVIVRRDEDSEERWTARQARKPGVSGGRVAMVMTSPPEIAGAAVLVVEQPNKPDAQWDYLPVVRRVRKLAPIGAFHPLLGTDFNYGDLGFVTLDLQAVKLTGTKTLPGGVVAYEVDEQPRNQWYYSRIVDLIAVDTLLPLQRDFYTPANELWKVEHFDAIKSIDGVLTPTVIRMEDRMQGSESELRAVRVRYDVDIPEAVFEPDGLPKLLDNPVWKTGQ